MGCAKVACTLGMLVGLVLVFVVPVLGIAVILINGFCLAAFSKSGSE